MDFEEMFEAIASNNISFKKFVDFMCKNYTQAYNEALADAERECLALEGWKKEFRHGTVVSAAAAIKKMKGSK